MFIGHGRQPIDDPAEALRWMASEAHGKPRAGSFGADPAAGVALTPREVGWLGRFLVSVRVSTAAMTLERLDGFFCALIAGPTAPPSEYMPVIWDPGDDPDPDCAPSYDSVEQQEFVRELLTRHWKTIAARLDRGYPHAPLLSADRTSSMRNIGRPASFAGCHARAAGVRHAKQQRIRRGIPQNSSATLLAP
jgi:yecA family protein